MAHFKISSLFLVSIMVWSCTSPGKDNESSQDEFPDEPVISVSERAVPEYQKNWKTVGVRGKVKEIFCTDYKQFVPDSSLPGFNIKENFRFDRNGNLSEESGYMELQQQQFSHRDKYSFDKKGNCLKTVGFTEDLDSIQFVNYKTLNKEGRMMYHKFYHWTPVDGKVSKYKIVEKKEWNNYEFVSDSLVIYTERENGSKSIFRIEDRYQDGNLLSSTATSGGAFLSKTIKQYDSRNNVVFIADSTDTDFMVMRYNYDEENRITYFSTKVTERGDLKELKYTYDRFGNQLKNVTLKNGIIIEHYSYTNTYTCDSHGNWTKRERRKLNGKLISVLKRRISYY